MPQRLALGASRREYLARIVTDNNQVLDKRYGLDTNRFEPFAEFHTTVGTPPVITHMVVRNPQQW